MLLITYRFSKRWLANSLRSVQNNTPLWLLAMTNQMGKTGVFSREPKFMPDVFSSSPIQMRNPIEDRVMTPSSEIVWSVRVQLVSWRLNNMEHTWPFSFSRYFTPSCRKGLAFPVSMRFSTTILILPLPFNTQPLTREPSFRTNCRPISSLKLLSSTFC